MGTRIPVTLGNGFPGNMLDGAQNPRDENVHTRIMCTMFASHVEAWAINMGDVMTVITCGDTDSTHRDVLERYALAAAASITHQPDAHFTRQVAQPFHWIAPDGIVGSELDDLPMSKSGFKPYCDRYNSMTRRAFETMDM